MQRLLDRSLRWIVALPLLSGCWHERFHTFIENGTNQRVYAVIHFRDQSPPGSGSIEPGNGVNMPQRVEDISYIDYQVGKRACRMDKKQIAEAARTGQLGVTKITLRDCSSSKP
jgi:hypothetical protein